MSFRTTRQVARLPRKRKRIAKKIRDTQNRRFITSVTKVDSVPVRCIQVDRKDGLYLVGESFIPTHNSRLAAEKIHAFLLAYPGATALVVRKTRSSMYNSTIVFIKKEVMAAYLRKKIITHNKSEYRFEYENGSILIYGGMKDDQQKEAIRSIGQTGGIDICWMEEATQFDETDFNEILPRMRGSAASWRQIIMTTNPHAPTHWIYQNFIIKSDDGVDVFYSSAIDNTHNPADYKDKLNRLTGVERDRLRDGKWVEAGGIVFDQWKDRVDASGRGDSNVTKKAEFEAGAGPVFWWVDDGYSGELDIDSGFFRPKSHPRTFLLVQLKQDGTLAVFYESYEVQMLAPEHIAEMIARCRAFGYGKPERVIYDRAAASLGGYLKDELGREWNMPASKISYNTVPVDEGNKEVNTRLSVDSNGMCQIIVHPRCKHLRSEMVSYSKDPKTGRVIKDFDHGPDALRIGIWDFIHGKAPEVDISTQNTVDLQLTKDYVVDDGIYVYEDGDVSVSAIII
jgi:hypothetical protein